MSLNRNWVQNLKMPSNESIIPMFVSLIFSFPLIWMDLENLNKNNTK